MKSGSANILMILAGVFGLVTIAVVAACNAPAKRYDVACYSGGGLIWKGVVSDPYYGSSGCMQFDVIGTGDEMTICHADCFIEVHHE